MTGSTTAVATAAVDAEQPGPRRGDRTDLWICWWVQPVFYNLFGVIFVLLGKVMPPQAPDRSPAQISAFFAANATSIKWGFGLLMVVIGFGSIANGLVAYQMKRMSVKPVFAYAYIA